MNPAVCKKELFLIEMWLYNNNLVYLFFITSNFWLLQFLIVTGLSSFFVFFYPSIELELDKNKIVFQSNDLKGTAPHDATFFYDITKIKSGNVFIDNNCYSEGKTFLLKKNMHYYSHTFPLPDYYAVRVISKGEWLTGVDVHVVTQGWETIINNELYKNIKPYNDSGYLHVNTNKLRKLDVNEENITRVEFRNIRDFHVDCDAMTFETRFMNNASTGGQGCYDSKIEVIGKKGRLSFNFVTPGCDEKLIEAKYGDVYLAGEFNDLNTFFQDISHWRTLKIVTGKKRVGVYLDDVQIYSGMYNMFLDEVKGLSISFIGSGAVDYVKLFNKDNLLVYNDNFVKD